MIPTSIPEKIAAGKDKVYDTVFITHSSSLGRRRLDWHTIFDMQECLTHFVVVLYFIRLNTTNSLVVI